MTANTTWWWAAAPIAAGVVPVVAALLLTGLVPVKGIALIPVTGILIGGALTATVLGGRRALDELTARRGEVEAGMALGLLDRDARLEIARPAASDALLPGLDQTRTVGLVTLPGAFVGMLLGGASPCRRARSSSSSWSHSWPYRRSRCRSCSNWSRAARCTGTYGTKVPDGVRTACRTLEGAEGE